MILQMQNVRKTYQRSDATVHALEDLSLEVDAGEFLVVRGPSGAGKTTLLLIAGTLLRPDAGTVSVAGVKPYEQSAKERVHLRAKTIGFVFQQFHLVPYLNVLDNVIAPGLAVNCRPGDAVRQRAEMLLSRLRMQDRLGHLPGQLSTGERQRVALARAMINEPRLLLADEPTGNLDPENGEIVLSELDAFTRAGGAVLVVTHHEHANQYAGRTVQLLKGELAGKKKSS